MADEAAGDESVEYVSDALTDERRKATGDGGVESRVSKLPTSLSKVGRTVHEDPTTTLVRGPDRNLRVREQHVQHLTFRSRQVVVLGTRMRGGEKVVYLAEEPAGNLKDMLWNKVSGGPPRGQRFREAGTLSFAKTEK